MVYYISVKDRFERENIARIIKEFDKNPKIYIEAQVKDKKNEYIKKSSIIFCDYVKEKIADYDKQKKTIIVYTPRMKTPEDLLGKKNIHTYYKKNELREELCFLIKKKQRIKKVIVPLILLFLIILISIPIAIQSRKSQRQREEERKVELKRIEEEERKELQWEEENKMKRENIVFLGDSITEGYDTEKFYANIPSINSGVSGYCSDDVIKNLDNFVYVYNPTKVVLLIGTNDIRYRDYGNDGILENIKTIIDSIKKNRSKAKIYVESIYPVNKVSNDSKISLPMIGDRENEEIQELNELIEGLCKEEKVEYIDMYDELTDEDGNLNIVYTRDGLHISEEGYEVITNKLKDILGL